MTTYVFRPQSISKQFTIKDHRLNGKYHSSYNWRSRAEWYPVGYKFNRITIAKTFQRLHYLACHAPTPIAKKYRPVYNNFCNRYFANGGRASMRYLNTRTAHSWL